MSINQLLLLIGELYSNLRLSETRVRELENENQELRQSLETASAVAMNPAAYSTEQPEGENDGSA